MLCFLQYFLGFGNKVILTSQKESGDMMTENCFKIIQSWGAVGLGRIKQNGSYVDNCGAG